MSKKALTPDELEAQADALLAAADNAKASPSGKAAASAGKNQKLGKNASHQDGARVLTDEEAMKSRCRERAAVPVRPQRPPVPKQTIS